MANAEGKDFKKQAVHLIWGEDEFLVSGHTRKVIDALCPPDQQALGLETIDADAGTVDDAVAAVRACIEGIRTVGFFGAGKVVWFRDATLLSTDEDPGKRDDVKDAVARLTEEIKAGLMPGQYLVITARKVDRRTSFYKTCKEKCAIHEFNFPEKQREAEEHMRETVAALFEAAGLAVRPDAMASFLSRIGTDTRQIRAEIEKLCSYLGERKQVTVQDVQLMVTPMREVAGWDLADAFGRRDLPGALTVLRQLLFQRVVPMAMISGLEGRVRDMIVMRECIDRRWLQVTGQAPWFKAAWSSSPECEATLSAMPSDPRSLNPFRAGILAAQARNFSLGELVRIQREVVRTHERLVSSSVDDAIEMELLLVKALGKLERAA